MAPRPVAFIDSGVGGLPYLERARRELPGRRFVYAADRANFPYGEKSAGEIVEATLALTDALVRRESPALVVVACNTMSVVALAPLRGRFGPLPFVGVVPAVKPAASLSRTGRIGVLATRQTVEGDYLRGLVHAHASHCAVEGFPAAGLVDYVERDLYRSSSGERLRRVREEAGRFSGAGIDVLVLGCTHFLHLETEFREVLDGQGITVVDSRDGVVRQAARLLAADGQGGAAGSSRGEGPAAADILYVTGGGPAEERYGWFARRYGLALAGAP